jgi:hypothetical protein
MKALHVLGVCAIAVLLTACDAVRSLIGPSSTGPPRAIASGSGLNRRALPEPKGRNLLYLSTEGDQPISVYTFPGTMFVGILTGPSGPRGLCANRAGDVFVPFVYIPGGVYEYAHGGGTPIAQLGLLYDWPNGCSIDPKTGALAVVAGPNHGSAAVAVYHYSRRSGWGLARGHSIPLMASSDFCGYDDNGNLFVDGETNSGAFALAELPKGGKAFITISVTQSMNSPGQVQWDGKHLAVGDTGVSPSIVYQFDISGSNANKVGATTLKNSTKVEQFWIQGARVVAPDVNASCGQSEQGCVFIYNYPAGGAPTKTIELQAAFGSTVSLAP